MEDFASETVVLLPNLLEPRQVNSKSGVSVRNPCKLWPSKPSLATPAKCVTIYGVGSRSFLRHEHFDDHMGEKWMLRMVLLTQAEKAQTITVEQIAGV